MNLQKINKISQANRLNFALNNTFSRDEADELCQEILFTALSSLPKLRDEDSFEPWLWGLAENVTKSFKRSIGKQRAMYSYDALDLISYEEPACEESLCEKLREKISMLSAIYRDIIILYYYDGLLTKDISKKLNIPEGTVRWRLSNAKKKLEKECKNMLETALRPIKMRIDIYGSGNYNGKTIPFPSDFIDDALSQNILYHCYEQAKNVEELAKLCGVPAYYVEDRLENLLKREAVKEVSKGKYLTDFIIRSDKYGIYCEENAEKAILPLAESLISALKQVAAETLKIDFYKAEKSESDLFYLCGVMAFSHMSYLYCHLPYPEIKTKYDGNRWCYIGNMETGAHHRTGIGTQHCSNCGGNTTHTVYNFTGVKFREMMYDNYINACVDIIRNGKSPDLESVSNAISNGYIIRRKDKSLLVTTPYFTKEQKKQFEDISDKILSPLMPEYESAVNKFINGYKKLFPSHLKDDADRMCHIMFIGLFTKVIDYGIKNRLIAPPSEDYVCDVLIEYR